MKCIYAGAYQNCDYSPFDSRGNLFRLRNYEKSSGLPSRLPHGAGELKGMLFGAVTAFVLAQLIDGRVALFTGIGAMWALSSWRAGYREIADYVGIVVAAVLGCSVFFLLRGLFPNLNGWVEMGIGLITTVFVLSRYKVFLSRRRIAEGRGLRQGVENAGLTSEQVVDGTNTSDSVAAIAAVETVQNQVREVPRAEGVDLSTFIPEVGTDITWGQILRHVFRVLEFDATDTVIEKGTPKAASRMRPYGYLLVESPILNQRMRIPIVHRVDFALAASVYNEEARSDYISGRLLGAEGELLVTYAPKSKLPGDIVGITHGLHFLLVPRGTLERYYSDSPVGEQRTKNPNPEELFGKFSYFYKGVPVPVNFKPDV